MLVVTVLVVVVSFFTIWPKFHHSKGAHGPGHPGAIAGNYADALEIAMQFFDIQKCTYTTLSFFLSFFLSNNSKL